MPVVWKKTMEKGGYFTLYRASPEFDVRRNDNAD